MSGGLGDLGFRVQFLLLGFRVWGFCFFFAWIQGLGFRGSFFAVDGGNLLHHLGTRQSCHCSQKDQHPFIRACSLNLIGDPSVSQCLNS